MDCDNQNEVSKEILVLLCVVGNDMVREHHICHKKARRCHVVFSNLNYKLRIWKYALFDSHYF